jgi:hypothetical protein
LQKLNNKQKRGQNSAFTACAMPPSLLETVTDAAGIAASLATILLSTAHSSFDELQNARKCGQKLCFIAKSISWGRGRSHPNISGFTPACSNRDRMNVGKINFSSRGFLREKHETNNSITQTSRRKDANPRQINE